jgi:hypothetical protein
MALRIKHQTSDSSWTTPAAGSIRVKSDGQWRTAISVKVKQGGAWVDSGYVAYPNAATSFTGSGGNGSNRQVTFTWTAPTTGAPVTKYFLSVYDASDNQIGPDIDVGNVTSYTHTFAASSTTYYVRLKSFGAAGLSQTFSTNTAGGTRLRVVIGAAPVPYDNSRWGATVNFIPAYWTQSQWPGEPYGDYRYHGSKAFDNDSGTYWTGQSWAWPGGSEWLGFTLAAGGARRKIVALYNLPTGNRASTVSLDEFAYPNFAWTGRYWQGGEVFGFQIIPCDFELSPFSTRYFRLWYTDLGYNPNAYGSHRVLTAEVHGDYQDWITDTGTVPATANTTANA